MTYRTRNIAIAVGLALVAMLLTLFYVVNYRRSVQNGQATVDVYVARADIKAGTPGSAVVPLLHTIAVPKRSVAPGAISSPNQIAGLVLSQPLYKGDEVTLRRFTTVSQEGISGQLKTIYRAVQVPGDPNQLLAGTLKIGDHVDLVANFHPPASLIYTTKIVLRNLDVLQAPTQPTGSAPGTQSSVILMVNDTQVQRLWFVLKNCDWSLQLRPALGAVDRKDVSAMAPAILTQPSTK
jgi:Flp pilus assembly protein CpaB